MESETNINVYKVVTPSFEGPFNLLLNLIEDRKLFINEISLASVTEDYIKYINSLENLNPGEVAGFVSVASTLILIKSKSLLPNLALTDEEEQDIKSLEDRLKLYDMYQRLGQNIKQNFGKQIIFASPERKHDILIFLPDSQITKDSMMTLANDVLGKMPKKTFLPEVEVKKVISIEEMIDKLTDRIQKAVKMNFHEFAPSPQNKEEKVTLIVGFLAILELARQGILNLVQENNFEDIIIEKQEITVETYESR